MAKVTDLANLDFNDIRTQLKEYLKQQDEFVDYDFEGAGISVLLDILSHNTHMNAMMSHLLMNESFLDTAQVRSNVVSLAQLIGYVPKSATASRVEIDITVQGDAFSSPTITLQRGTKFSGKINNKEYVFVTETSENATKLNDNSYRFYNVLVYEGSIRSERYVVDSLDEFQKYELNSDTLDTTTLRVTVYENANTSIGESYNLFSEIAQAGASSPVYFIKENPYGRYDIYFGDNYIGKKPENGSIIEVEYIETLGKEANNIIALTAAETIDGLTNVSVSLSSTNTFSYGGAERENIESIRYNAPIINATQDRAVTANDYRSLILTQFPQLSDVSVWGGEEATPPVYGRVFISPALTDQKRLSESLKSSIISYLSSKNIGAIKPDIVESEYTNIILNIGVYYDTDKTSLSVGELQSLVISTIDAYNDTILSKFDSVFRSSNLLTRIDNSDEGIINSIMRLELYKTFTPNPTLKTTYTIEFPSALYIEPGEINVRSDSFYIGNTLAQLGDEEDPNNSDRRILYFYNAATGFKLDQYTNVGYAVISTGTIVIQSIKFDLANDIKIYAHPDSYDVAPRFNQLLNINASDITVEMKYDTVSGYGAAGLSSYSAFKRHV